MFRPTLREIACAALISAIAAILPYVAGYATQACVSQGWSLCR